MIRSRAWDGVSDNNTKLNMQSINNCLKLEYHALNEGQDKKTDSWVTAVVVVLHFYCIFLFVLNAVLNTDLQGSSSLELFQMGRVGNYCGGKGEKGALDVFFTYRTPRRRKNFIRVYRQKFLRKYFTV